MNDFSIDSSYVILINDDNGMVTTRKRKIMQNSNLVDILCFLIHPDYAENDMENFSVSLHYYLPVSAIEVVEGLALSEDSYDGYLLYKLPIDTELTAESGDIHLSLTFSHKAIDENGDEVTRIRKVSGAKLRIEGSSPIKPVPDEYKRQVLFVNALPAIGDRECVYVYMDEFYLWNGSDYICTTDDSDDFPISGLEPNKQLITDENGNLVLGDVNGINISSSAKEGQTIVVKKIDNLGNPIEWECVDVSAVESIPDFVIQTDEPSDTSVLWIDIDDGYDPCKIPDLTEQVERAESAAADAEAAKTAASGYATEAQKSASSVSQSEEYINIYRKQASNSAQTAQTAAQNAADYASNASMFASSVSFMQGNVANHVETASDAATRAEAAATIAEEAATRAEEVVANIGSCGNVDYVGVEPADDDIPKVYFSGTLPTSKNDGDVQLTMHYISKTADFIYPVTLKVQGGSSVDYPKKNFTLKPYKDATYESKKKLAFKNWPEMNKFVLKAHWIDHSHVRNVGTAKIWGKIVKSRSDYDSLPEELRNAPNNGATDGFTVKVFCNGVYQGLYEWIVAKDKLFGQDKDIQTHSILNSEWNNQPTCAFSTTSPTMNGNWSEELQDSMSSDVSTSFANLIKFVAGSTDEEFVANAENYFDVQSVIDFDIFARVFCIVDNLCRNQIFFTYDGVKWYEGVWDVDAVIGLPPTTRGFFAYNTEFQTGYIACKDFGMTNLLYQRVETLFMDRFKARYAELRSGVLSIENILDVYERLTDVITTYDGLLAEDYASTTGNGAFTGIPYKTENTIQQIRTFVSQRIPYMDAEIEGMSQPVPCTGITLSASEMTFTEEGSKTLTANITPEGCTDSVIWESDNADIATVSGGVVTAVANGNATITVRCGNYSASCSVSVSGISESATVESDGILNGVKFMPGFVLGSNGLPQTSSSESYSSEIPISDYSGNYMYANTSVGARTHWYGEDGSQLSWNNISDGSAWLVPDDAEYGRMSISSPKGDLFEVALFAYIENEMTTENKLVDQFYSFDKGVLETAYGYSTKAFQVIPNTKYLISGFASFAYCDENDVHISGQRNNAVNDVFELTTPNNCKILHLNWTTSNESNLLLKRSTRIGYFNGTL